MKFGLTNRFSLAAIMRGPEDGTGAGDPAPADPNAGGTQPSPESVLFPDENKAEGDQGTGDPAAAAGDWKEYEPDPNKTDEENAAAKAEHDKTKPPASDGDKVPEDGKYDFKVPEGMELDSELAGALGPEFAKLGLTQTQAQALVDKYAEITATRMKQQHENFDNIISGWAEQAQKDPEIGGAKWDESVSAARRAVERIGTPAFREYLNVTGAGNHPEVIRFMTKVGAMIREDSPASGGAGGAGKPADPAHILFPDDAPKG